MLRKQASETFQRAELQQLVLNDAGLELNDDHCRALSLGLSFIPFPAPPSKIHSFRDDLEKLRRSVNLRIHWDLHSTAPPKPSLLSRVVKSNWQPPEYIKFSAIFTNCMSSLSPQPQTRTLPNVPKRTLAAWRSLGRNPFAYILKADKGGKVVCWGKEDYRKEALRQLKDTSVYSELSKADAELAYSALSTVKADITAQLKVDGNITTSEADRLLSEENRMPGIYFLPKIHKEKREDTGTFAGRPITAAVGGLLKSIDEFLAHLTAPLLPRIPGSLTDTRGLIVELEKMPPLPENAILFSADVESLYPSIPWDEGIAAATRFYSGNYYFLLRHAKEKKQLPPPKPKLFRKMLEAVLRNHFIHFQHSRYFHQISGTAMGCSISVYFANTFMYYRTRSLLSNPPPGLLYLARYIDDLIGIFCGDPADIPGVFAPVIDRHLRLTYDIGGDTLKALDLLIKIESDRKLTVSLYRKPTEGHQYVHWSSAHPSHLKKSLPFSQLLRVKRNSSKPDDYRREADAMMYRFRRRGYPKTVLEEARKKADAADRSLLLAPKPATSRKPERLTLVTNYVPGQSKLLREATKELYEEMLKDPAISERAPYMREPLPTQPPRLAFRSGITLGNPLGRHYKKGENIPLNPNCALIA